LSSKSRIVAPLGGRKLIVAVWSAGVDVLAAILKTS
jgi:hypothetical protein